MQATLSANGNGPTIPHKGGASSMYARGTFGSGTLQIQFLPPGDDPGTSGNWINVSNGTLTAAGVINFCLPAGSVRAVLSGATSPSIAHDFGGDMGRSASG